jgi:hypothetical protein
VNYTTETIATVDTSLALLHRRRVMSRSWIDGPFGRILVVCGRYEEFLARVVHEYMHTVAATAPSCERAKEIGNRLDVQTRRRSRAPRSTVERP